ncbi:hypothetical protein KIW84_020598 [Lathyrus oleraceus]|uniref:DUF4283 domain-containing protein n=1 Tax=Pisum sativum TaxID=3888 RepID=A0A9D4Y5Y6_PEA|nr:hypothetical protein KIW84_020598 [Pisum sativum]
MVTWESCKVPDNQSQHEEVMAEIEEEANKICIEEHTVGGYECPQFMLQQLWARMGVLSIVDLGQDYYLVAFSSEEDHQTTLMEGPWLIYDHYFTMHE